MTSRQANMQDETHFWVMHILQDNPDLTQRELEQKLGISVGGLNYCLNALINKGFAEKVSMTSRFLKRKMDEYDALKGEIEALKAEVGEKQGDSQKVSTP
jgi:predicted transcriptional regulator